MNRRHWGELWGNVGIFLVTYAMVAFWMLGAAWLFTQYLKHGRWVTLGVSLLYFALGMGWAVRKPGS